MIQGSAVALVTPFKKDGSIDFDKLKSLVNFHIEKGTDWILPCGTTGESATLSHDEHRTVIKSVIDFSDGTVPVIAGTGSNNTKESLELTKFAAKAGANACLIITPYYNKPTQEGMYQHFKTIAESVHIPIVLYNVPGRTGINLLPETVVRLSSITNIIGIKEASGNIEQAAQIVINTPDDFVVMSGDDALTLPIMSIGGRGVISVTANILPDKVKKLVDSYINGDWQAAFETHKYLLDISKSMFIETNPIPAKTAMAMMGLIEDNFRLPLVKMSGSNKQKLEEVLKSKNVI